MPEVGVHGGVAQVATLEELLRQRPELLVGALVSLVVIAVVILLIKSARRPPGVRFADAIAQPESISVLMHPDPDPDAMSCAIAVALIAERQGTPATIQYSGEIRHQENRAFRTVLDLTLEPIETVADITADEVVLVDHGAARGFPGAERIEPYAVIDHHPGGGEGSAFTDLRPDVGACASILATYLDDLGWVPTDPERSSGPSEVPTRVTTGLVYGIHTDTKSLTRGASSVDFRASEYLLPGIDGEQLVRMGTPDFTPAVLDIKARAIAARDVRHPFVVSDVGTVSTVDAIPQSADELLRLEGVSVVVIIGEYNGTLHISGRSRDDRVHIGHTMEELIPEEGSGGGHARMGGGQCPAPADDAARAAFVERTFDVLAGHRS